MIHFSINKNLFLQALNTTKRAISSKNAIPILSTVKTDVTNEGVTLIGSNGQIQLKILFLKKMKIAGLLITSLGSILLEASFFINVVSSLPDVTLDFKEIEQNQIVLTSGKSEITLKGKIASNIHESKKFQQALLWFLKQNYSRKLSMKQLLLQVHKRVVRF